MYNIFALPKNSEYCESIYELILKVSLRFVKDKIEHCQFNE